MELEQIQYEEVEKLNRALKEQNLKSEDITLLRKKVFNPQSGELQLLVDNGRGGVKMASVNIFE